MNDPYANIDIPQVVKDYARKIICRVYCSDWASWKDRAEILVQHIDRVAEGDYHVPEPYNDLFASEIVRLFNFLEPMEPEINDIMELRKLLRENMAFENLRLDS
jgi:hypothetical protein